MLARCSFHIKLAILVLILIPFTVNAQRIVVDPGHGGSDGGNSGICQEKKLNLNVADALNLILAVDPVNANFSTEYTRLTDVFITLQDRVDLSTTFADAFISIHHNFDVVGCKGFVMYNDNHEPFASLDLANDVVDGLNMFLWSRHSIINEGAKLDEIVRPNPPPGVFVLFANPKPAVLGEPFGISCSNDNAAIATCFPTSFSTPLAAEQAFGYYTGLAQFFFDYCYWLIFSSISIGWQRYSYVG